MSLTRMPAYWPLLFLLTFAPAVASGQGLVVLGFDELQCGEAVGNFYAGGTGGSGSGPGPNFGVSFPNGVTFSSICENGGNTTNLPSPPNGLTFLSGTAAQMNVPAGFTTGFSFYYSAAFLPGVVNVWSDLNGQGTLLATLTLPTTPACPTQPQYCVWTPVGVSFSGTAKSVDFGGTADHIGFDNITLGAQLVGSTAPDKLAGNPLDQPGGCSCGDPISVGNGNLFEQVTDYQTAGPNKLTFTRYYNSQSTTTFAFSLGSNWRSTYDRYLRIVSPASVQAERADGQVLNFTLKNGFWKSDSDVDISLTRSGSTWTLVDANDTTETYTALTSSQALLSTIQFRNRYTQNLLYSGNKLLSVIDSFNRTLTFSYLGTVLQTVTTPDGLVLTYGFASSGAKPGVLDQLVSVGYSTTPQTSQTYLYENTTLPLALTGIIDEDGNRYATWTYDAMGRAASSQLGTGASLTTVIYNDSDGSRTVVNALGANTVYKFTTLQGVPKLTEIDRQATGTTAAGIRKFTYDGNGYLSTQTDWNGNLTTYVNDDHGRPSTIVQAAGTPQARTATITYHAVFHLPAKIVEPGITTTFTYDAAGEPLTKTETDTTTNTVPYSTSGTARTWIYTWSNGLIRSIKTPRADVSALTQFAYDNTGALSSTMNALGQMARVTSHMPGGLPQTAIDVNGVTTQLTYDARLRLSSSTVMTRAGALTTSYSYDAAGNLLSVRLPDGATLTNSYDLAHRLIGVSDSLGQTIAYTLDALGNRTQISVSDIGGTVQQQRSDTFDVLGYLAQDTGGAGQTSSYARDANGNPTAVTDPLQRVTQRVLDAFNRVVKSTDRAQGVTVSTYDAHNRPLSITDANGGTTTYIYDGFGNVTQRVSPDTGTTVYRYDLDGNLMQRVDGTGAIANYSYDALDRVKTVQYPTGSGENSSYTYDESGYGFSMGRLTTMRDPAGTLNRTYDERGNVVSESRGGLVTAYTFDAAGRLASIGYPSGWIVRYARDTMGRTTAVTAKGPGVAPPVPVVSNISYQPFGPINAMTFGNGVAEARTFDLDYRVTSLVDTGSNGVQNLTYGYDTANNVLSIADGITAARSQQFTYDALDRLTGAAGGYGNFGYTYDAVGNRLTEKTGAVNTTYTYTAKSNRLATITANGAAQPVAHTAAGNLSGMSSSSFTYNQAGRLSAVMTGTQQLARYTYDAFGRRLVKFSASGVTAYRYDLGGHLLEEIDNQGIPLVDYVYLDGMPVATLAPKTGQIYFLHDDRIGTPQAATDISQTVAWAANYQPFGGMSSVPSLIVQNLRLPGQEFEAETGIYHNGFRNYSPNWGRYFESDPIGLSAGLNTYTYAVQNPLSVIDPLGLNPAVYISSPSSRTNNIYIPATPPDPSAVAAAQYDAMMQQARLYQRVPGSPWELDSETNLVDTLRSLPVPSGAFLFVSKTDPTHAAEAVGVAGFDQNGTYTETIGAVGKECKLGVVSAGAFAGYAADSRGSTEPIVLLDGSFRLGGAGAFATPSSTGPFYYADLPWADAAVGFGVTFNIQ